MKAEYDLSKLKSRKHPCASGLKKPVILANNHMVRIKWPESVDVAVSTREAIA